jgi:hypothetical protein
MVNIRNARPHLNAERRVWLSMFCLIALAYALTAHWFSIVNIDTIGAAWPAWNLVHHHTLFLDDTQSLPQIPWFFETHGHLVSNRMAGVVLIGVPAQLLLAPINPSPLTPAILTAVVVTALAMANLCLLLMRAQVATALAMGAAVGVALGTGFWTTAGAELWTHGPDALWLSLGMLSLQRNRLWLAGVWLSPMIWTRPHLAVAVAAIGIVIALSRRRLAPLVALGVPACASLVALQLWNRSVFGAYTLAGGVYEGQQGSAISTTGSSLRATATSAAGSLISPLNGLFVFSPFIALAAIATVRGFRKSPDWVRGCALGGVLYQAVQWRLNSFTGGTGLYSYRLPLEMILLAAPLGVIGWRDWAGNRRQLAVPMRALVGFSIGIHLVGAYWYRPLGPHGQDFDPWRVWEPWSAAQSRGSWAAAGAVAAVLATTLLAVTRLEHWQRLRARINAALPSPTLTPA